MDGAFERTRTRVHSSHVYARGVYNVVPWFLHLPCDDCMDLFTRAELHKSKKVVLFHALCPIVFAPEWHAQL